MRHESLPQQDEVRVRIRHGHGEPDVRRHGAGHLSDVSDLSRVPEQEQEPEYRSEEQLSEEQLEQLMMSPEAVEMNAECARLDAANAQRVAGR